MGVRVLLVDDEPELCELWSEMLTAAGHEVVSVGSVGAARERVAEGFAVAVVDWTLPDGKGSAVIAAIEAAGVGTRTVLVSGLGPMLPAGHGADVVLAKPFRLRELVQQVNQLAGASDG